jgi:hypothetical protein
VLDPVLKSAGPFHVSADGSPLAAPTVEPGGYVEALAAVPVYEVSGGVDFDAACDFVVEVLGAARGA